MKYYVSFRDDNIRVDHKWTDGVVKFAARRAPSHTGQEYTYAALTAKPDMPVVQVDAERAKQYGDHVSWKLADARKSILAAGGRLERGHYIIDMEGEPVEVGKRSILHGKHNRNNDFIYPVLGEVLKNAVRVNELGVREELHVKGKKDDQVNSKFVYLGAAAYGDEVLPVRIQIDRKAGLSQIGEIDVLKSFNTKRRDTPTEADSTGHRPPRSLADARAEAPTEADSQGPTPAHSLASISISNLIGVAQPLHPQIFSKDVAAALNKPYQGGEIGAKFAVGGRVAASNMGIKGAAEAEAMEKTGADREKIWRETGWWKGKDGKWRVELPDAKPSDGTVVNLRTRQFKDDNGHYFVFRLGELVDGGQLNSAYPGMVDEITLRFRHGMPSYKATYSPKDKAIELSDTYMQRANKYADETNVRMSNDATTLIVHELQHAIQQREVFASGADADKLSIEDYHNTSGEVEARNVQARLGMTAEQRAATPPWETEDVPESRQIVKFAAGRAVNRTPEETEAIRQEAKSKNDEANKTLDKLTALKQELDAAKEAGGDTAATAKKEYYQKINKQFGSDFAFDFGRPYGRLASYVPDRPLRLTMQVLLRKMKEEYRNHHPFTFDEAKDLAINVNDPAFFMRRDGATTGVRAFYEVGNGRIFCVSIKPNGEINEIETLYPKDIDRLATMLTSLKNAKKALLDLDATKAVAMLERQYNTAIIPELRDSLKSAISVLKDVAGVNGENLENSGAGDAAKLAAGGRGLDYGAIDLDVFVYDPGAKVKAMGEGETRPAGLAAAVEKREALRPWTKKQSPADLAKPIAFDAADMVMFWKAVSGAKVNPHVQKGERINGRRDAVGLNVGGDRIELVSRLFGVLDQGDIPKLHEECRADGFFRNEDPEWCAGRSKYAIEKERDRSQVEVDRRARELYELRVRSGEGGEHYSTQVLGHEIGHTLGMLPAGKNLGPVGNAARTLYDAMTGELKRQVGGTRKVGERAKTIKDEARRLIAWWHGQEEMPKYYEKDKEMFAEVFGIFLTQPESVQASAPTVYDACVKIIAGNERLAESYRRIAGLKWSGKSNDRVMAEVRKTWDREAQEQFRQLEKMSRESVSRKRDWFNYALNDRFGPMFAISQRGLKAERKALKEAVARGEMSEAEAADRLKAKEDEINALKTSLYNWQRQSGGQTRLMVAGFDEVRSAAERDGVSWSDVRDYAHNMRVIELGGRATAHGIDPARAAAILDEMKGKLGAAGYAKVEKTWKAFRAVYEREVLEDANVKELFDEATNKMLFENKHYVTMKHRMGVEEAAEWKAKIEEYRKGNRDAWDPCIDIQSRLHKGLGGGSGEERGFVLYHLEGSFEATEDPIAATIRRAIEIKESAARNHLVKQASETLRALGAKGVYDTALEGGAKPHAVNQQVYGKLTYMDGGVRHEVIVPKVVFKSFKGDSPSFGEFGKAMRFIRNTMTLWNPMFINRAYLMDRSSLETNLKGMHRAPIDVLSEALCIRGVGVPLYMVNNYLTRFTPICNTWLGKLLWNENTANHYAYRAQKIARICYEGRFGERLEEARRLREIGENGRAQEIEENVAVAKEMLRKNIFQSAYQFDKLQAGFDETAIMQQFGYRIEGGANPATWRGRAWEKAKAAGRRWSRFEEEQEAVTKIIAYLYEMKKAEREAGPGGKVDGDAVARTVIEQGGTPNLAARGVAATYLENATGFFWNVRKEGMLRTWRALKDHPTEWLTKNLVQTAIPAFLKGLMVTGGLEMLIRKLFDDDEEKIKRSWWAPAVIEHAQFTREAMKCVPGYYQRNYNVLPLAKFGDHVLSLRVKYSPEEFAIQNAIHTAMQKFGADPTDPDADWSTLAKGVYDEFLPNIFGSNYGLDWMGTIIGPLIGVNPYDSYRGRNIYDDATWKARWDAPGNMLQEMGKNFWNYSPFAPFVGTFKGQDRGPDDGDVPAWLDRALTWPVISRIPASMLTITSSDSYTKALGRVDERRRAYARLVARDVLAECIKNGKLGGLAEGLKDVPQDLKAIAVRHVVNGWRQYHMDPKAKELKRMRAIKDPELKAKARKWIEDSMLDD
ncbi:MAG: hypothetical protein IJG84_21355 [Kiritimatiellae bacterium]|nr:hypothetical protein [Kiritimatiellia bacterium]